MNQREFDKIMKRLGFSGSKTIDALKIVLVRNKSATEAARETGCDPGAISRALKKLMTPIPAQPGFAVEREGGKWIVTENWDRP